MTLLKELASKTNKMHELTVRQIGYGKLYVYRIVPDEVI